MFLKGTRSASMFILPRWGSSSARMRCSVPMVMRTTITMKVAGMSRTRMLPQGHMMTSQDMRTSDTLKYISMSHFASCRPCAICRSSPLGNAIKYAHRRPDAFPHLAPLNRPFLKMSISLL